MTFNKIVWTSVGADLSALVGVPISGLFFETVLSCIIIYISDHLIPDREREGIVWRKLETLVSPFSYLIKTS